MSDGTALGLLDGISVGVPLGCDVGISDSISVGLLDGIAGGAPLGLLLLMKQSCLSRHHTELGRVSSG